MKIVPVYAPYEYYNVIRTARRHKKIPYIVIPLEFEDFFDLKLLAKELNYNLKLENTGVKLNWREIMWFRVEKHNPNTLKFKYDYGEEFREVNLVVIKATRRMSDRIEMPELKPRYDARLPISKEKKKDLMKLCDARVIPEVYHHYYTNLPCVSKEDRLPVPDLEEEDGDTDED
jgi:hypothetical protein